MNITFNLKRVSKFHLVPYSHNNFQHFDPNHLNDTLVSTIHSRESSFPMFFFSQIKKPGEPFVPPSKNSKNHQYVKPKVGMSSSSETDTEITPDPITLTIQDMCGIGPGPSSSHTVGPMTIASEFRKTCLQYGFIPAQIHTELRGSLSLTGRGHHTDRAILAGLCGWKPEKVDPDALMGLLDRLDKDPYITWGKHPEPFDIMAPHPSNQPFVSISPNDIKWNKRVRLPKELLPHPNTCVLTAIDSHGVELLRETWISIGGGFVELHESTMGSHLLVTPSSISCENDSDKAFSSDCDMTINVPYPFHNAASLFAHAEKVGSVGEVILANDRARQSKKGFVNRYIDQVFEAMRSCIHRGLTTTEKTLPGELNLQRRAPELYDKVVRGKVSPAFESIARASAYAMAVNEENAAGGLVVRMPTNGAAGVVPAVLVECVDRLNLTRADIYSSIAAAAGIAMIIKTHATLSGADGGCQAEVGSAVSMAAAMLCELYGGKPHQVSAAAEIGMESSLGLTCDPYGGLVQVPCIERNGIGVSKAWAAANLALHSPGSGIISLDQVIQVMKKTGLDMSKKYKETSLGGLAVIGQNQPEC